MEQGHDRADTGGDQLVDEVAVKLHALFVDLAHALRNQARPGDREPVVLHAHFLHERDVFAEAMVMVAGDVAGMSLEDLARLMREAIPYARALAVFVRRALDLIGGGRRAPDKVLAEAHSLTPPSATPAMMYFDRAK